MAAKTSHVTCVRGGAGTKKQAASVSQGLRQQFHKAVLARKQAQCFLDQATSIKQALKDLAEIPWGDGTDDHQHHADPTHVPSLSRTLLHPLT
jgi:hypothetical protein